MMGRMLRTALRRPFARRARRVLTLLALIGWAVTAGCVGWTRVGAYHRVYSVTDVPPAPVALVLGAGVDGDGSPSAYLQARLTLAKQLYDAGKVRALLVSGDNSRADYNEPDVMRAWLIEHGVPQRRVVADYAGFDTYDSCARARDIFGVRQAIVITQTYHVPRAVTLCRRLGIDATGVGDNSVRGALVDWAQAGTREQFACVKAAFDVVSRRDPVFLGVHEPGIDEALRD
jgi:vancomycin permeability regulator SanA